MDWMSACYLHGSTVIVTNMVFESTCIPQRYYLCNRVETTVF